MLMSAAAVPYLGLISYNVSRMWDKCHSLLLKHPVRRAREGEALLGAMGRCIGVIMGPRELEAPARVLHAALSLTDRSCQASGSDHSLVDERDIAIHLTPRCQGADHH